MSLMASLPKGKQMVQKRLGLYRQVPQGHNSDAAIELSWVRRIQSGAKTTVVPLPLAQRFCPAVIKGCSGQGGFAWAIPAPGNSHVWHGESEGKWLYGNVSPSDSDTCILRRENNQT